VSPDGARLFFNSDRPIGESDVPNDLDTWYVEARDGRWGEPVRMDAPYNSDSTEVFVSAARDGTLYFRSDRDGTRSVFAVAPGESEARITPVSGATGVVSNPLIDPDGRYLIVAIADDGPPDLYFACRHDAGFGPATAIDAANSPFADFAPAFGPGGRFYFTSERPGQAPPQPEGVRPPGDIWSVPLAALNVVCAD
jgi:Tol biopolymer transport system component